MVDIVESISRFRLPKEIVAGTIAYFTVVALILGSWHIQEIFYESKRCALESDDPDQLQEAMSLNDILSLQTTLTSILGPLVATIIGYYFMEERVQEGS